MTTGTCCDPERGLGLCAGCPRRARPEAPSAADLASGAALAGLAVSAGELSAAAADLAAADREDLAFPTFAGPGHEPRETEYFWQDYMPLGSGGVVPIAAERESGKGLTGWNLIAAGTTGALLPGEEAGPARQAAGLTPKEPVDVLGVWDEDDANEDNAWRARAAGADLSRVFDLSFIGDLPFELSAAASDWGHLPQLLAFLRVLRQTCLDGHRNRGGGVAGVCRSCGGPMRNPRLVILDPLDNIVMKGSTQSKQGAGRLMRRLRFIAREAGVTIVPVLHTVKSGAIGGSAKLLDIPRRVIKITADETAPGVKIFTLVKSNGARGPQLRYRIIADGHNSRIEWCDPGESAETDWRDELAARREARTAPGPWQVGWAVADGGAVTGQASLEGEFATLGEAQDAARRTGLAAGKLVWLPIPGEGAWKAVAPADDGGTLYFVARGATAPVAAAARGAGQ